MRADLLRALGGFDPALSGTEDWDLWIRLAAGAQGAAVAEVLWAYVEHGTNMLSGAARTEAHRPDFERLAAKHAEAAERLGVGQLARAVLALGGAGIWQRMRSRVVGPTAAPAWLAELAAQPSAPCRLTAARPHARLLAPINHHPRPEHGG